MSDLIVHNIRGTLVDARHHVSVAVVDANGELVARSGDPGRVAFLRSAAKPFQAIPLVADGAAERFGVTQAELALAAGSHSSEPEQVALVRAFLERIGCAESDLACRASRPLWRDYARLAPDERPDDVPMTPLASDCSGKHAAMLALARHHGWPTEGYHAAGHPVQNRVRDELSRFAGVEPRDMATAVDGCGVVAFALPLSAAARAYARLAASDEPAACRVVDAMRARPDLVAGRGRLCTRLMQAVPSAVAKIGAGGFYGAALTDRRLGLALKVEDGNPHAAMVALVALLDQLGVTPKPSDVLTEFVEWPYHNSRGEPVAALRATGRLALL